MLTGFSLSHFRFMQKRKNAHSVPSLFPFARAELPVAVKDVDVGGSEVVEHHVAARLGKRRQLIRECPVLAKSRGGDFRALAVGEKNPDCISDREARGNGAACLPRNRPSPIRR